MKIQIEKGADIPLAGAAEEKVNDLDVKKCAYTLADFKYLKPRVQVEEGQQVKKGELLFTNKKDDRIRFVSPISGRVAAISRGARRALLHVIIEREGDEKVQFESLSPEAIQGLDGAAARQILCDRGLWPYLRQRPYDCIPDVDSQPEAIFIRAVDSAPLAADPSYYLQGRETDFRTGIELLKRIGVKIHIITDDERGKPDLFQGIEGVEVHSCSGPHPRGNLSVHLQSLHPTKIQARLIWHLRAQEVVAIGRTLSNGEFDSERIFSWTGSAAKEAAYYRGLLGCDLSSLPKAEGEVRIISGDALSGQTISESPWLGFLDHTVTAISEGRERKFLGWLAPGAKQHSFTRTFLSALVPSQKFTPTTCHNGAFRAIVDSEIYDRVQPLDIPTPFFYKSLVADDIDEAERMGLWAVAPEDFALASYMCPCKTDFCGTLQKTLDDLHYEEEHSASH